MAEGNGEVSLDEVTGHDSDGNRTENFSKLLEYGLDSKVAVKLDDIYKTGKLAHIELDERALDALIEFPTDGALNVLEQFLDSNLEHVSNKSAYLCGVMKTYRQKSRAGQQGSQPSAPVVPVKGPDEDKINEILTRTGYKLDVTTGQRKYGGPPPGWEGSTPGSGCEVFCGKIPKDLYEDEIIPLFESCGTIWDLRLMMDPMTGSNRGYAFVTFTTREAAQTAVRELDNHEIKPGKRLKINISVPNLRLFVGNIPKSKGKEEILDEFGKLAAGLMEVIIYSSPDDKKKNRGFCFLEYESHKAASLAKRRLGTGRIKVWGCDIIVDWADPQEEPDESTMSKVKVLYVRNLTQNTSEENLKNVFQGYGNVERVKKLKDYAFVHFEDRDNAVKAMRDLDGTEMGGANIEVSLAKPPSDKKKKEEVLRARERRMMQMIHGRGGGCSPSQMGMMGRGIRPGGQIRAPIDRDDYDYDYDYYGYGVYRGGYTEPYYHYDELYFDYSPPTHAPSAPQGRIRSQPVGRGRGTAAGAVRAGAGGRGAGGGEGSGRSSSIISRGEALGCHTQLTHTRSPITNTNHRSHLRGNPRAKGNLPGKRKLDGGHQNQGGDTKRRMGGERWGQGHEEGESWGSQPLAQQPLPPRERDRDGEMDGEEEDGERWHGDGAGGWS